MKQYEIKIHPAAYFDMKEARAWYRAKSKTLPKRFLQQVKITIQQIKSLPFAHAVRYNNVRIANVAVFPYAIHFVIENDRVIVLAVHHTAINPQKWKERPQVS